MRTRSSATHLAAQAEDTFEEVVRALGLKPRSAKRDEPFDFSVSVPGGTPISVEVKAMALPTADRIGVLKRDRSRADLVVVVADQVPAPARAALDAAGLGWLDRRGHLRMVGHGLFIDTDLAPEPRRGTENDAARRPIAGRAGLASATALLLDPDQPVGVSDTARIAGLNPSSITRALAALSDANLAERVGRGRYRPLVPELFWALADVWPRERTVVRWSTDPQAPDDGLAHPIADPGDATWVAGGVRGALEWGAPIVATSDLPVDLYLPTERDVRRVAARHAGGEGAEVRLTADPNGFVGRDPRQAPGLAWPLAHPLFCALDLTAAARDREALDQWTPPEPYVRVW